jgi:hypothetical protein
MVNVGICYDYLEYFMAHWYNLWPFGIVCGHLLYFSQFGMFGPRKIWQHWSQHVNVIFLLLFIFHVGFQRGWTDVNH